MGKGDRNAADAAAVDAMRSCLMAGRCKFGLVTISLRLCLVK